MLRTRTAGSLRAADAAQTVTLAGWVARRRDHGGVIFIDLRDASGVSQVVFREGEVLAQAHRLRSEFCVAVTGVVEIRPEGNANAEIATGDVEVNATSLTVLGESAPLPFQLDETAGEEARLKYRYLDLRREGPGQTIRLRSKVNAAARGVLDSHEFVEIETPTLTRSTPEGARDFLVPARLQPGSFYALPQSPQLFKQLLMVAGMERYYQIARCYRDEDFRADRQPEFTQLDMEMSFVDADDVIAVSEEVLRALKQRGVPVAGADRLTLSAHPVFQDLLALGRVALHPADDLTLAGVLRSPLCDLSEEALFDLAHGREGSLWGVLNARADLDPALAAARNLIADFREAARGLTPFDLYGRLLNRLDGRGLSMRQRFLTRLGSEAADAMDAFLDQARAAEGRGPADLERFCHLLASLDQTIKREMDEPRGEVRVMTAHSSKGLEAPVVILPDVIFEEPRGDALLETDTGAFLWCGSSGEDCAASQMAREARKRRGEDESLRLLYVG
ncbi:MAG: amino acid--tRNA ligase-related protein, partial [Dietzia sp.]|nr:amino acid--tRNA ligase-related protein [Dietzia sp.]